MHVVGVGEQWGRELPGLVGVAGGESDKQTRVVPDRERMKIAWRYERLGQFGSGSRGGIAPMLRSRFRVYNNRTLDHARKTFNRDSC